MKTDLRQLARVRQLYALRGGFAEGAPLFKIIEDEGYEECNEARFSGSDARKHFSHFISLRRKINPKVKLCDILAYGFMTIVSEKVKTIIEQHADNCIFYPARWQDENGNYTGMEYYVLDCHSYPGGELPVPHLWNIGYGGRPYNSHFGFSVQMVKNLEVFRSIFDNFFYCSEEVYDHLIREKCKFIDLKRSSVHDVEWDISEWLKPWLEWTEALPEEMRSYAKYSPHWVGLHRPHWLNV